MKNFVILFAMFLFTQAKAQQSSLIYDDNAQVRQVGNFTAINVSSAIDLYLTQGETCQIAVSATDNETRDRIKTYVEDGTLYIKMEYAKGWKNWNKWGNNKLKAYVSVHELFALTGSGASNIHLLNKMVSSKLLVKLSGASDLKGDVQADFLSVHMSGASDYFGNLKANALSVDLSGASSIQLKGEAENVSLELSGASDAKMFEFSSTNVGVNCSGASTANIKVANTLKAHASGASDINYKGEPINKEFNKSGGANIRHKD
jgi:hypothetical protein